MEKNQWNLRLIKDLPIYHQYRFNLYLRSESNANRYTHIVGLCQSNHMHHTLKTYRVTSIMIISLYRMPSLKEFPYQNF